MVQLEEEAGEQTELGERGQQFAQEAGGRVAKSGVMWGSEYTFLQIRFGEFEQDCESTS